MTQLDLQQRLEQALAKVKELEEKQSRMYEKYFVEGVIAYGNSISEGLKKERDALQQRVNALAAENANMRNAIDQTIGWQESVDADNAESVRVLVELKTPATDAIKRQWMAEGVQEVLDLIGHTKGLIYADSVKSTLSDFAAQLRQPEEKGNE